MGKFNYRLIFEAFKYHWQILIRGIARMLAGTIAALLFAVTIYGFTVIKHETGYIAVFDFIASLCTLCIALCNVYGMGRKRGSKK